LENARQPISSTDPKRKKVQKMKTIKPHVLIVTEIIIIFTFLFWMGLLLGYVADEWSSPPANNRITPAAKTH
jgi:hypothetical protein